MYIVLGSSNCQDYPPAIIIIIKSTEAIVEVSEPLPNRIVQMAFNYYYCCYCCLHCFHYCNSHYYSFNSGSY